MAKPRRIALLIGSPFGGLTGVTTDIESIRPRLRRRGFECRECVGPQATRARILEQLARLCDEARPGDAVIVYYSGHGGRAHLRDERGQDSPDPHNFLVPIDYESPVDHARAERDPARAAATCRGVADFELTLRFHELSERTRNVTVILDCCHAATMVRGEERMRYLGGARLYQMPPDMARAWAEYRARSERLPVGGNPHVVRVVATAAGSSAFEAKTGDQCAGYLTRALCAALDDTEHAAVSWDGIIRRVREQIFVQRRSMTQRPEVEGPRSRLPFSLQTDQQADLYTLTYHSDGAPFVRMGRIHGLNLRDRLEVLDHDGTAVAFAEVAECFDDSARVVLRSSPEPGPAVELPSSLPAGGSTVSASGYHQRVPVWVDEHAPHAEGMRAEVEAQMRLRLARDPEWADICIRGDARELRVETTLHIPRASRPAEPTEAHRLIQDLDDVARSTILRRALAGWAPRLNTRWSVDMVVTLPGQPARSWNEQEHAVMPVDTRLYFELRHVDRGAPPLYVHVLEYGVSGRLTSKSGAEHEGVELRAPEGKGAAVVRIPKDKRLKMEWPDGVPRDRPRAEEFIVIASLRPLDLRSSMALDPGSRARQPTTLEHHRGGSAEPPVVAQVHPDRWLGQSLPLAVKVFRFDLHP